MANDCNTRFRMTSVMETCLLLSIKPEFCHRIFSGEKRFEFRKQAPRRPFRRVIIYSTVPIGLVVGEFTADGTITGTPEEIWKATRASAGITEEFYREYFKKRHVAHALKITKPNYYAKPLTLAQVSTGLTAPQNFRYLPSDTLCQTVANATR